MSCERSRNLVDGSHQELSVRRQCDLLALHRSTYYYEPAGDSFETLALMRRIDELFMEFPFLGSRKMRDMLRDDGMLVGRRRVRRLMRKMGLMAVYQKPRTSIPRPAHTIYPYLLRDVPVTRPNQVWCSDITCIPIK